MPKYTVLIKEALVQRVAIDASSEDEAEEKVRNAWENGEYVLDSEDLWDIDFTALRKSEVLS